LPLAELETGIRRRHRDGGNGMSILFVPGFSATVGG
jgi:hypothetical protein